MTNEDIRQKIVAEALSWIDTPYHLGGRIKGAGVDCATLILQVMVNTGVFTDERLGYFGDSWWQHTTEERYAMRVLRHATKVLEGICYRSTKIEPGNIVLGRIAGSKVLNHGAIVIKYPMVVHAINPCVALIDITRDSLWATQYVEVFDPLQGAEL